MAIRVVLAKDQHRVMPTETERIAHRHVDLSRHADIRRVVQIAFRVLIFQVDGGRHEVVLHRHDGEHGFDRPRRAHEMPGYRLSRTDRDRVGGFAKRALERQRFTLVVERRARAVGVDLQKVPCQSIVCYCLIMEALSTSLLLVFRTATI